MGWIDFFAEALRHSAQVAIETGRRISEVFRQDREQLRSQGCMARTLLMVQEALQAKPLASIASLTASTGFTTPTVTTALRELVNQGIVRETTGRVRGRVFAYKRYLEAMSAEEEQAPAPAPAPDL